MGYDQHMIETFHGEGFDAFQFYNFLLWLGREIKLEGWDALREIKSYRKTNGGSYLDESHVKALDTRLTSLDPVKRIRQAKLAGYVSQFRANEYARLHGKPVSQT